MIFLSNKLNHLINMGLLDKIFWLIVSILSVLRLGKILEICILKKPFPNANIKQIENFIKNTKSKDLTNLLKKRNQKVNSH